MLGRPCLAVGYLLATVAIFRFNPCKWRRLSRVVQQPAPDVGVGHPQARLASHAAQLAGQLLLLLFEGVGTLFATDPPAEIEGGGVNGQPRAVQLREGLF